MKHQAKSIEIQFGEPEAFALAVEQTTDGDRIAKEEQQLEADRKTAEANQLPLV